MKTVWSKPGAPKGRHVNRRWSPENKLAALIKWFKAICVHLEPTKEEVSIMVRNIDGYQGPNEVKQRLKGMLPTLPDHIPWVVQNNKTLADVVQFCGVKFESHEEQDGFFDWLAVQTDPDCFNTFLRYQQQYHRVYQQQKAAEKALVTAAVTATGTPVKIGTGAGAGAGATNVMPAAVAGLGSSDDSLSDDELDSEDEAKFLGAGLRAAFQDRKAARKRKNKSKRNLKALRKTLKKSRKGMGKTDKSGSEDK